MKKWTRALYQPNLPLQKGKFVTACEEHIAVSRQTAEEGMVLLKNENQLLPLEKGSRVALFGKGVFDYVKGGGGSADVTTPYERNLYDGIKYIDAFEVYEPAADFYRENIRKQYAEGGIPGMTVEPELDEQLAKDAAHFTDTAIIVISRFSGEGWDRSSVEYEAEFNPWNDEVSMPKLSAKVFPDGDFYLTKEEKAMVEVVKKYFDKIVVMLNTGSVITTSWIKDDEKIGAAFWMGQGGMEGGTAAAEALCGMVNPSGKLVDTWAANLDDYPSTENYHESVFYVDYTDDIYVGYRYFETIPGAAEKVCYPFGHGLSYTEFDMECMRAEERGDDIRLKILVTNTGSRAGKEVVQIYYGAPQGKMGKPAKELAAFKKTRELLPGESQVLVITFAKSAMASFDDLGKVAKSAWVLEKGNYAIYVGNSVRNTFKISYELILEDDVVTEQLTSKLAPTSLSKRMLSDGTFEELPQSEPLDPDECVLVKMISGSEEGIVPESRFRARYFREKPYAGSITLMDVYDKKAALDEFVAQLDIKQLIDLLGGQPNTGIANTWGFGNLPEYGVPNIMTADGSSGLRVHKDTGMCTTGYPCPTMVTSTWNYDLAYEVAYTCAAEVKENNICVWLTPALNLHRNPLCGRNFEYFSEDPLMSGMMGIATVKGTQAHHVAATPKHFAVNNKETNRKQSDSRLSERALREIYLKGFEMIVKESDPWVMMSSYNIINGRRASESSELLVDILRDEWGFKGVVTSDWWNRGEHYKEIKAGNDIKMANGYTERVLEAMDKGAITREEIEVCVKRVLELIMKID